MEIVYWAFLKSGDVVYHDGVFSLEKATDSHAKEVVNQFLANYPGEIAKVFRQTRGECLYSDNNKNVSSQAEQKKVKSA